MQVATTRNKRNKLLLILLVFPFCCLCFYALDGGKSAQANEQPKTSSLNAVLPSPQVEGNMLDKMSLYRKAEEDAAKNARQEGSDLFDAGTPPPEQEPGAVEAPYAPNQPVYNRPAGGRDPDRQVAQLEQRLQGIQELIRNAETEKTEPVTIPVTTPRPVTDDYFSELQAQMAQIQQQSGTETDSEMKEMKGVLDRILDVQHPSRVTERLRDKSMQQRGRVVPVTVGPTGAASDYFGGAAHTQTQPKAKVPHPTSVFYGGKNSLPADTTSDNTAIAAVVHHTQQLVPGAWIKIRLIQPVYVDGQYIPKGTCVYGSCSMSGERLTIQVTSLGIGDQIYPVRLEVFDYDANPGIPIPGSITRDASKQAADRAIQSVALNSLSPTIEAQAASAGIETAKNLLSRKVRLEPVTVNAGHPLLLRSTQTNF